MTACSSGADQAINLEPRLQRMVPTEAPAVPVTPRNGQPAETRQVSGKYFTLYVPANFQEKSVLQANGEQLVAFDAPSSKPASPVRVGVLPNPNPKITAIESTYGMELVEKQNGATDFTRSTVKWPGAQSAILLQWTAKRAGALDSDALQRNWQIVAQVNAHLIVNFVAIAPAGEFDTAGLAKIIETFRPHA